MKNIRLAHSAEEFTYIQSNAYVLPIVGYKSESPVYFQSDELMIHNVNVIAGEDIPGVQTEETNVVNQLDNILGEQI